MYLDLPPLLTVIDLMADLVNRAIAPEPVYPHEPWPMGLEGINALRQELPWSQALIALHSPFS